MASHPERVRRNYAEAVASEAPIDMGEVRPLTVNHELVTVARVPDGFMIMTQLPNGHCDYIALSQEDIYKLIRLVHEQTTGEPK